MMPGAPGQVWRYPWAWTTWLRRAWFGFLDRTVHRHCLPPLRYPMSVPYQQRAKGPVAARIRSGWNIEWDDVVAIRRRAEAVGITASVEEWIERRAFKCSQIYTIQARDAFKALGLLEKQRCPPLPTS